MNYLKHLVRSKGTSNLFGRAAMIFRRFGFTRAKSAGALLRVLEITSKHGCTPTFFITADLLDHHEDLIRTVCANSVQVGLHGHHHIDHSQMSGPTQRHEISNGVRKFQKIGIPVKGFRGPYLRFNKETARAVRDIGLSWVSNAIMLFDEDAWLKKMTECNGVRDLVHTFYTLEQIKEQPSLPIWGPHCLEIPISLPDDELLLDRFAIREPDKLSEIWLDMLSSTREQGELFNCIFHPERIDLLSETLDALLEKTVDYTDVWISPLDDIAGWWQERANFSFEITQNGSDVFNVTAHCSKRASVVLQHSGGKLQFIDQTGKNRTFPVHSGFKPVIHVPHGYCDENVRYLKNEGFVLERDADPSRCAFALNGTCSKTPRQLLDTLNQARGPLLRFWRWPNGFRSALAITADVDAITLMDFVRRAWHFLHTQTYKSCHTL